MKKKEVARRGEVVWRLLWRWSELGLGFNGVSTEKMSEWESHHNKALGLSNPLKFELRAKEVDGIGSWLVNILPEVVAPGGRMIRLSDKVSDVTYHRALVVGEGCAGAEQEEVKFQLEWEDSDDQGGNGAGAGPSGPFGPFECMIWRRKEKGMLSGQVAGMDVKGDEEPLKDLSSTLETPKGVQGGCLGVLFPEGAGQ
ncbi:hypothetical protein HAX54_017848 [Datura stramonium]|uniref:Uncharacterized protein n=1 Tax=Datura stramonium TaxID=4076 RepID=A0ABS8ULB9_DATST|nr:hypothetical protein [Datura stramonium]